MLHIKTNVMFKDGGLEAGKTDMRVGEHGEREMETYKGVGGGLEPGER